MNEQLSFFPDPDANQDPVINIDEMASRIANNSRYAGSANRTSEASIDQGHGIIPDFPVETEGVQDDFSDDEVIIETDTDANPAYNDEPVKLTDNDETRVDYNSPKEKAKLREVAKRAIIKELLGEPSLDSSNLNIELTSRDDGTGRSVGSKSRQWELDRATQREQARKERG